MNDSDFVGPESFALVVFYSACQRAIVESLDLGGRGEGSCEKNANLAIEIELSSPSSQFRKDNVKSGHPQPANFLKRNVKSGLRGHPEPAQFLNDTTRKTSH